MIDQQGRLFGKVSILDIGAVLLILGVLAGLLVVPSKSGYSVAQVATAVSKPVEIEIMVRGLTVKEPDRLLQPGEKTSILIRNQERGKVDITKVEVLIPKIPVPKLDGTVVTVEDPRLADTYVRDFAITLAGNAQVTGEEVVLAGEKVKIGTPIEIEGARYSIRGSVMGIHILNR
ncbi:MAG: DUF4330 domain-containing protein [Pseudanabaenaceae cyanobacterium SKYGB_i_bin29]|nr:DUF4330 domain-containing protein [Pseudanabaenaceae cyanobacterium SKYG29]MDW8420570.1 DUF4330 domain-containing protein [Pseudanabaenaceae cyanobacterium SKYGB_i_bin29]